MKYYIFFAILIAKNALSQDVTPTMLVCNGKYSNYKLNVRDVDFKGAVIKVFKSHVYINGFPMSFHSEQRYTITNISSNSIRFTHDENSKFNGNLNRFTGEINLNEFQENSDTKVDQIIFGSCGFKERIF